MVWGFLGGIGGSGSTWEYQQQKLRRKIIHLPDLSSLQDKPQVCLRLADSRYWGGLPWGSWRDPIVSFWSDFNLLPCPFCLFADWGRFDAFLICSTGFTKTWWKICDYNEADPSHSRRRFHNSGMISAQDLLSNELLGTQSRPCTFLPIMKSMMGDGG